MTRGDHQVLSDRYRLTDAIGRGGMADVYSARDTQSGRMVAVKVMRMGEAADPERFAAEMEILDRLSHPAIVRLFDTGRTSDDSPYFVMQLIEGESLSTILREEGPVEEATVVDVATSIAGALAHAHEAGVVHRDIKPANILLDSDGCGYLTDFGVARLVDSTLITRAGTTIGTAAYLAPEQLQQSSVGPAADIYSLGLVMIEAFTGRRAFPGSGAETAMARLGRDPALPTDLPETWTGLLLAMTRRESGRRPTAAFVERVLRGEISPPPTDPEEYASRHTIVLDSDEMPTAVTELPGGAAQTSWDPPSSDSGARLRQPVTPPPPPGPSVSPFESVPHPWFSTPRRWQTIVMSVAAVVAGLAVLTAAVVFAIGTVADEDPVVGDTRVDEAAREVLRVIEASEVLRASDPSLQRRLRLLSGEMVESVNEDRLDGALRAAVQMTAEVRDGIERMDIDAVAFRSLLDALRTLTQEIQTELETAPDDTS